MRRRRQGGSTLTEFVVIGPLIVVIALTGLQVAMLYQARLGLDLAAFEAARAGARASAQPRDIREAWFRGLSPLLSTTGLLPSLPSDPRLAAKAVRLAAIAKELPFTRIEVLSPSREAFDDFADPELQAQLGTGELRVIPNQDLGRRSREPGRRSGVSIQEANVLRLRIVYGYRPRVPLVGSWFTSGMSLLAGGADPFRQGLLAMGRVPVEVEVSMPMISPAVESGWIRQGGEASGDEVVVDEDGEGEDGVSTPGGSGEGSGGGASESGGYGSGGGQSGGGTDEDFCTD